MPMDDDMGLTKPTEWMEEAVDISGPPEELAKRLHMGRYGIKPSAIFRVSSSSFRSANDPYSNEPGRREGTPMTRSPTAPSHFRRMQ